MNKLYKLLILSLTFAFTFVNVAVAETGAATGSDRGLIAIGASIAIGLAVIGGGMGQGKLVAAIAEAIGRNPSASGNMTVPLFVGLALIESLVILSFIIALGLSGKV